jgi:transposase
MPLCWPGCIVLMSSPPCGVSGEFEPHAVRPRTMLSTKRCAISRARGDMKDAERRARQRLLAFLLRHHRRDEGKSNWTQAHARWLETIKFEHRTQQIVLQEYIDCVTACTKRVAAFDKLIAQAAAKSVQWPVIQALMALRGIALLSATLIVAEIGDMKRFATAPQLMTYSNSQWNMP